MTTTGHRFGFTLVEIMIVVSIIGLLAAIATPAFIRARQKSQATAIANDFRVFGDAFKMYTLEYGAMPGEMEGPAMMADDTGINEYLDKEKFTNAPSLRNGGYDWDGPPPHAYCGISIRPSQVSADLIQVIDEIGDDGNVNSGTMRWMYNSNRFVYIVE